MASPRAVKRVRGRADAGPSSLKPPLIILFLLTVVGVGGYFAYDWYLKQRGEEYREQQEMQARVLAQKVVVSVRAVLAPLNDVVDPVILAASLNSGDDGGVAAKMAEISAADENVIGARVLDPGYAKIDYEASPPIGYATLDLLRRSEKEGKTPPVEVHLKGTDDEHIAVLRRIEGAEESLLGHLILFVKLDALKPVADKFRLIEGYAELQQTVPKGRPLVLARMGDPAHRNPSPLLTVPVPETAWRWVFWPKPAPMGVNPLADLPVNQIGAALAAVLLCIVIMVVVRRKRAVKEESPETTSSAPKKPVVVNPEAVAAAAQKPAIEVEEMAAPAQKPAQKPAQEPVREPAQQPKGTPAEAPATMASEIFRAYDIRGVVGKTLTSEVVKTIGRAIGTEARSLEQQTIAVGRDGRASGPELAEALIEGLRATGCDVVDVGEVPTPVLYFATHYLETGSGVMVTGSHNPPEYNGLKIMLAGETLFGDRITALRTRAMSGEFESGSGNVESVDVTSEYIRRVTEDIPVAIGNAFKVVIDCGNGVAGAVAPQLIRALGHDVTELYCEVDGSFPNHHPDPSVPENLKDLIAKVKENGADIGFAFDGDGDRLGVVDGNGAIIYPDRQLMLFARDVLSRNPGAEIVFDVKCTNRLPMVIEKLGGKPVMWKTGHSFIKGKLKETGAPLAGEMSGHIFFKERWYGFDDALYASARLLEILMGFKLPPAEVFKKLPKGIATPELRVNLEEGEHLAFMERLKRSSNFGEAKVITIDGLRVEFADSWGLVRASNTTPSLVLRFEGDNKEALIRIGGLFKKTLLEIDPNLKLPF